MKFEIGKFYKHTGGHMLHVLLRVPTTMWGHALIAESVGGGHNAGILAVGSDESATVNYVEASKLEWDAKFS